MYSKFITLCLLAVSVCVTSSVAITNHDGALMVPITLDQWNSKLSGYQPNVVVVDMWAMWCTSCIERFPEMVKMHQRYKDNDIVFISMNLDDREDTESINAANRFLHKMNASFEHFHMDENIMHTFEQLNLIGIPAVLIYNQQGEEQFRLTGDNPNKQFTEADIEQAIQTLIKQ